MILNDKIYNAFKTIITYILPELGTLYFALSEIWNLPYASQIVGTISAITAFLGMCIGISKHNYSPENNGVLQMDTTGDTDVYRFVIDESTLEDLKNKSSITLSIDPNAKLKEGEGEG